MAMNRHLFATILSAVVLSVLCAGCASVVRTEQWYQGDPLPADEVSMLSIPYEVDLIAIDGQRVPLQKRFKAEKELLMELLPGSHEVTVRYYMPNDMDVVGTYWEPPDRTNPTDISYNAVAGQSYKVGFNIDQENKKIDLFIEDADSGKLVAAPEKEKTSKPKRPERPEKPAKVESAVEEEEVVAVIEEEVNVEPEVVAIEELDEPEEDVSMLSVDSLERLKYWWLQAGESDRKEFRKWIIDAP